MKQFLFLLCISCLIFISCQSSRQQESASAPQQSTDSTLLNGSWELNHLPLSQIPFDSLYAMKRPVINIAVATKKISGNSSCNGFSGPFELQGTNISFPGPMMMTKMACPGEGERAFMETLNQVNSYTLDGNTLTFRHDGSELMRFVKK